MFALPIGRPALMGILNVTPDSFSDGALYPSPKDAVEAAVQMIEGGADLIDVGGESTRPGAAPISLEEEIMRVMPVLEQLSARGIPFSIDTRKPEVACNAIQIGASVLNDVGGLRDEAMLHVAASSDCSVCIMHMQGEPQTMQANPVYKNVINEIKQWLLGQAESAQRAGVKKERLWLDPGIGFGKTVEHNVLILRNLEELVSLGYPVLIGVSRKGFLGKIGSRGESLPVNERVEASIAAQCVAQMKGAKIIRAHDVKQAAIAINVIAAIAKG